MNEEAICEFQFACSFIKLFLISQILLKRSTLINLSFLIKEDFWYVVLILDFTGLDPVNLMR